MGGISSVGSIAPRDTALPFWCVYGDAGAGTGNRLRRGYVSKNLNFFRYFDVDPVAGFAEEATETVTAMRTHPRNQDIVYVATTNTVLAQVLRLYRCSRKTITLVHSITIAAGGHSINDIYVERSGAAWFVVGAFRSSSPAETADMGVYYAADGITFARVGSGHDSVSATADFDIGAIVVHQTAPRRIWTMHMRTSGGGARKALSYSDDEGTTWTDVDSSCVNAFANVRDVSLHGYPYATHTTLVTMYSHSALDTRINDVAGGTATPDANFFSIGDGALQGGAFYLDNTRRIMMDIGTDFIYSSENAGRSWSSAQWDGGFTMAFNGYSFHTVKDVCLIAISGAARLLIRTRGAFNAPITLPNLAKGVSFACEVG